MKKIEKHLNLSKLFIAILAVVIVFSMSGCPNEDEGNENSNENGNGNGSGNVSEGTVYHGNNLALSGQVYMGEEDDFNTSYLLFNGNLTIIDPYGGRGQINGGNLSYSIGIPLYLDWLDIEKEFFWGWDNITYSRTVRGVMFSSFLTNNFLNLYRSLTTGSEQNNTYSYAWERVVYVYVDNDVTITGKGWTDTETEGSETYTYTATLENLNLQLKAGWNTVYSKSASSITYTGTYENPTSVTFKFSSYDLLSNPSSLKWVMQ
jgi:hypothetical protein